MSTKAQDKVAVSINFRVLAFRLVGDSPYMQCRFSEKAMQAMKTKMEAGSTANKGKQRKARDFDDDFKNAMHISEDGWIGVPASAFRNACIDVCRAVGFKMTLAKRLSKSESLCLTPRIRCTAHAPL